LLTAAPRSGGWRRYDSSAVEHIEMIRMARELGFAIEEIRTLINGFSPETPPPERWRRIAREKLPQLDELIHHASAMKRLLEVGLSCRCVRIEDCFVNDCANVGTNGGNTLNLVPLRPAPASALRAIEADRSRSGSGNTSPGGGRRLVP
jgi:DNA-binding transcriptional MerR regulator